VGVEVIYFFHLPIGKRIAGELVKTSVDIGFALHRLEEINAFAHRDNKASIGFWRRMGLGMWVMKKDWSGIIIG
jgi:RimJ/RimL family protein N-acetyltransferase